MKLPIFSLPQTATLWQKPKAAIMSQRLPPTSIKTTSRVLIKKLYYRYDLASSGVDKESFRFDLWSRYMKSALRQNERTLTYGEPQGEADFRETLSDYIREETEYSLFTGRYCSRRQFPKPAADSVPSYP